MLFLFLGILGGLVVFGATVRSAKSTGPRIKPMLLDVYTEEYGSKELKDLEP